jgi:S-adenosylmethionine:tRNA ribosyltransferase-isomerase
MRVDEFDFSLPESRIALTPASPRDSARMLVVRRGGIEDLIVRDLPSLLRRGDMLVLNDSKVIPAQLEGRRAARGEGEDVAVEATLIRRLAGDAELGARWLALVRPARRLRRGDEIAFASGLRAVVERREEGEAVLRFNSSGAAFDLSLAAAGRTPLPPYIARKRATTAADARDYQTIYAEEPGSVAAPTAGLHFTERLLSLLAEGGIAIERITLHVGAGTFLPVKVEDTRAHFMHAEEGEITPEQARRINAAKAEGGRIVAVGTTTLRLLESAADAQGVIHPFAADTDIFITPGHKFRTADLLLTNFHLPRSTLFMLVCAFAGTAAMRRAYRHAIEQGYRFYSYGDACLLERRSEEDPR